MRTIVILCAVAGLAACASPSSRIAEELGRYGLEPQRAQCIGTALERDLSNDQLRQLASAASAYAENDPTPDRLTVSDLRRVAASVRDPAVPVIVLRAAGRCGLTFSDVLR